MSDTADGVANWHGDVVKDLAKAFRRDGLHKSAECLEDALLVLAQEEQELSEKRKAGQGSGLKLVAGRS